MTETAQTKHDDEKIDVRHVYGTLVQLATHGQENKWWMLYIFITFNSILLLSCAALFGIQSNEIHHRLLLSLFSGAGTFIDVCWFAMAQDYVNASNLFSKSVVDAEYLLPERLPRPMTIRQTQRDDKNLIGASGFIAQTLPITFIVMYIVILFLTWWPI